LGPGAFTIKLLRILYQASMFVQISAFVTDNRKDTSLLQNLSGFLNYESVKVLKRRYLFHNTSFSS